MAYTCWYSGNNLTSSDDYLNATASGFEACGWDLHDDFTDTYKTKVYKSQGENNQYLPGFVEIWHQNTANVYFRYYMYWDDVTHIGETRGYWSASYCFIVFSSGYPLQVYGDRDWIVLHSIAGSTTYYQRFKMFGHIKPYDDNTVTLIQDATSGADKVLTVSGSLGDFVNDRKYMIVGDSTEGRDPINVDLIDYGSTVTGTLTVTNLPRNYDAGATIGHTPYTFAVWTYNAWRGLCDYAVSSVTDSSNAYLITYLLPVGAVDPDISTNRWILQPVFFREIAASSTPVGYITSSGIAYSPTAAMAAHSANVLFTTGNYESGSSTNSSTSTMLNDSSKAWDTNEHVGKVFIYTSAATAASEGQTRVIASNDATNLYWNTPLYGTPVLSDEYRIYDGEVWRRVYAYACRELIY